MHNNTLNKISFLLKDIFNGNIQILINKQNIMPYLFSFFLMGLKLESKNIKNKNITFKPFSK